MSMRMAKGLEADLTIIIGLEDGVIPTKDADIAETARLLYVSMTRAKSELHLFHARKREGSSSFLAKSFKLSASRYLGAIPAEDAKREYVS
jgi:superfamily I DNA/RNA helicase